MTYPGRTYHKEITDSTQSDARHLVLEGTACHGDICTASYQHSGRGRIPGRVWEGEKGLSLMMSLLIDKKKIPPSLPLSLILGLALSVTMEKYYQLSPRIKWPNDIYLSQKKAAGILCESVKNFYLCGMGINLNQDHFPESIKDKAVSLKQILHRPLDNEDFMIRLKKEIFLLLQQSSPDIQDRLNERLYWRNKEKTLVLGDPGRQETLTGFVRGVNSDGALLFESAGKIQKIYSAEFIT